VVLEQSSQAIDPGTLSRQPISMKISAVIPTYNRLKYIDRAIASVLAQSRPLSEIIVVDDGSSDETVEHIQQKYGSTIRVVRQQNTGVSGARRRGLIEATGEWIAFLDSDDEWTEHRNEKFYGALKPLAEDVAWMFGDVEIIDDNGSHKTLFQTRGLDLHEDVTVFEQPLRVQFPFQFGMLQASVIRRQTLLDLACFSENLRHSEDVLAGFQVALKHRFAALRDVVTKLYRTSDLSSGSIELTGMSGEDYFRARMLAFALAAESDKKQPWGRQYAMAARSLCKVRAAHDGANDLRWLAAQQFRFGLSPSSVAFYLAALAGRPGVRLWSVIGNSVRSIRRTTAGSAELTNAARR
jgi:hypothetical protein